MGIITSLKTLENVERFFHQLEENRKSSLTIKIHPGKQPCQPPMQEHEYVF
jgi:hypothetical protein